jgi:DNA-binding transcriptional MerR regulator
MVSSHERSNVFHPSDEDDLHLRMLIERLVREGRSLAEIEKIVRASRRPPREAA